MKRLVFILILLAVFASSAVAQTSQYLLRSQMANDSELILRVRFIIVKVAIDVILNEEGTVTLHEQRVAWSIYCLRDPEQAARRVAMAVVTDLTLTMSSTDAQVEAVVVNQWNAYSLAYR